MSKKKKATKSKLKGLDPAKDFDQPVKREPRQKRLPSMDDPEIEGLHALAEDYAELRDQRMAVGKQEVELKGKLLDLMKAHKKEHYHHDGIDVTVVHEKEKVKVKVAGKESNSDGEEPEEGEE
jgi:hypothetical protein